MCQIHLFFEADSPWIHGEGGSEVERGLTCSILLPGMALTTLPFRSSFLKQLLLLWGSHGGCVGGGRRAGGNCVWICFWRAEEEEGSVGGAEAWGRAMAWILQPGQILLLS